LALRSRDILVKGRKQAVVIDEVWVSIDVNHEYIDVDLDLKTNANLIVICEQGFVNMAVDINLECKSIQVVVSTLPDFWALGG
jgi:hypothetical protein